MSDPDWGYFIWYRLAPGGAPEPPWSDLLAAVEGRTGIRGRLYGPAPDGRTWMEVYEPVPAMEREGFEQALGEALAKTRLEEWLPEGEGRHVEAFPRARLRG